MLRQLLSGDRHRPFTSYTRHTRVQAADVDRRHIGSYVRACIRLRLLRRIRPSKRSDVAKAVEASTMLQRQFYSE